MPDQEKDVAAAVPSQSEGWCRLDGRWLTVLLLTFGALYWGLQFREQIYPYDATVYLAGAKSLAAGDGYRFADHVGQPRIGLYPPLTSLIQSLVFRVFPSFPDNLRWLNALMIVEGLAVLTACFVALRQLGIPRPMAAMAVTALGSSPSWVIVLFGLVSDPLFTALCFWLLVWWLRRPGPSSTRTWLLTGVMIGLAYLSRTAALALIVGLGAIAMWQSRRHGPKLLLAFGLPVIAAMIAWKWLARGGTNYFEIWRVWIGEMGGLPGYVKLLGKNACYMLQGIPLWDSICPLYVRFPEMAEAVGAPYTVALVICELPSLVLLILVVRGFRRSPTALHRAFLLLTALYAAEVLLVPFNGTWFFQRYLVVLWPLLFAWGWQGLANEAAPRRRELTVGSALGAVIGLNVWLTVSIWTGHRKQLASPAEFAEVITWLRENTGPRELIAADWSLPTLELHAALQRPLVADYLANPKRRESPVRHEDQGRPPAAYLVSAMSLPRTNSPPGLLTPVFSSSSRSFQVFQVNVEAEREYQRKLYGPDDRP